MIYFKHTPLIDLHYAMQADSTDTNLIHWTPQLALYILQAKKDYY